MRLYQRKKSNGERVWWASWTEEGRTVRRSTRCTTKAAAELVVVRWERERADPVYAAANDATLGEEARLFLNACRGAVERGKMAPETLGMYRQKAGTLVRILTPGLRLANIDGSTFAAYLDARRADFRNSTTTEARPEGKAITESTLYKEWVTYAGILKQAWRAQRFGRDPRALKPPHFGPEYKPRETALTWPQVHALLRALPEKRRNAVAFALATGARRKEVFASKPEDLDGKAWTVRLRGTKTQGAARIIPIPMPMRALLAPPFLSPGFAPWGNSRRALAHYATKAGVPVVTWNDLRRTFASLLVQAGVAPHLVAKLLGHSTTAMVDRVYGRQTAESLAGLIDAVFAPRAREPRVHQKRAIKTPPSRTQRKAKPCKTRKK